MPERLYVLSWIFKLFYLLFFLLLPTSRIFGTTSSSLPLASYSFLIPLSSFLHSQPPQRIDINFPPVPCLFKPESCPWTKSSILLHQLYFIIGDLWNDGNMTVWIEFVTGEYNQIIHLYCKAYLFYTIWSVLTDFLLSIGVVICTLPIILYARISFFQCYYGLQIHR